MVIIALTRRRSAALNSIDSKCFKMVGVAGFEPTTPRPPGVCATGLRHTPTGQKPYKLRGLVSTRRMFETELSANNGHTCPTPHKKWRWISQMVSPILEKWSTECCTRRFTKLEVTDGHQSQTTPLTNSTPRNKNYRSVWCPSARSEIFGIRSSRLLRLRPWDQISQVSLERMQPNEHDGWNGHAVAIRHYFDNLEAHETKILWWAIIAPLIKCQHCGQSD